MSQFEEDTAAANKLFVEVMKLVNLAENFTAHSSKADALEEALRKLNKIIDDYPSSDLAVRLISGQDTGSVSLTGVREAMEKAQVDLRREEDEEYEIVQFAKSLKLAKQGNAAAQAYIGSSYYEGYGVESNSAESFKWTLKAAKQGLADAQFTIGNKYHFSWGVDGNDVKAVKWWRKAAEQGDARAQFNLGIMYDSGRGVPKNKAKAAKWFRKAAEQGDGDAKKRLEKLEAK